MSAATKAVCQRSVASVTHTHTHKRTHMFTYSDIAKVYFDCVEELPDDQGAIWQCKECPVGKGRLKRKKGGGWTMLGKHGQSHAGWEAKVKAAFTGSGPMDSLVTRKVTPAMTTYAAATSKTTSCAAFPPPLITPGPLSCARV